MSSPSIVSTAAVSRLQQRNPTFIVHRSNFIRSLSIACRYIGMEYIRTNNIPVAQKFLEQAEAICPSDPLVLNELGIVVRVHFRLLMCVDDGTASLLSHKRTTQAFARGAYERARKCFEGAIELCASYPHGAQSIARCNVPREAGFCNFARRCTLTA